MKMWVQVDSMELEAKLTAAKEKIEWYKIAHKNQASKLLQVDTQLTAERETVEKLRKALKEISHDHFPPGYECRITEICKQAIADTEDK